MISLFTAFRGFSKDGEVKFGCVMLSIKFDELLLSGVDFASAAASRSEKRLLVKNKLRGDS
jgi:hypothetical protein